LKGEHSVALKFRLITLNLIALLLSSISNDALGQNQSTYTSLDPKQCTKVKTAEAGDHEGRCRGVGGYSLLVVEGDLRQNITVITPQRAKHSLELWQVVSSAFSSIGPKAEWRVTKKSGKLVPYALIVRFNASEDAEHPDKMTSYLAVVKITSSSICVTDKIPPGANANEQARAAADNAASKACLQK
jgi:hypothetical protein